MLVQLGDGDLDRRLPRKGLDTIRKHLREMLEVQRDFAATGLSNYYARSKEYRGQACLDELNLKPEEGVLVGDTLHDYEAGSALGCDCLLVPNGHQSHEQLRARSGRH